jgi:hypothetical protein
MAVVEGEHTDGRFNGTRTTEEVTYRRFRGADGNFPDIRARPFGDRVGFCDIVERSARAVRIDVLNIARCLRDVAE